MSCMLENIWSCGISSCASLLHQPVGSGIALAPPPPSPIINHEECHHFLTVPFLSLSPSPYINQPQAMPSLFPFHHPSSPFQFHSRGTRPSWQKWVGHGRRSIFRPSSVTFWTWPTTPGPPPHTLTPSTHASVSASS